MKLFILTIWVAYGGGHHELEVYQYGELEECEKIVRQLDDDVRTNPEVLAYHIDCRAITPVIRFLLRQSHPELGPQR